MDFNLITILVLAGVFAAGAFLGVLLGRRSSTANAYTDRILEESKELRERLEAAKAKLKARGE